jgi:hypothetical protein
MNFNIFGMKSVLLFLVSLVSLSFTFDKLNAQTIKTIENIECKTVCDNAFLDKIELRSDATVFYFRYLFYNDVKDFYITIYPHGSNFSWFLRGAKKVMYKCTAVKNVRQDGKMINEELTKMLKVTSDGQKGSPITFTCEIHFKPLKSTEKKIDLIEAIGQKRNKNNFNFLNIRLDK